MPFRARCRHCGKVIYTSKEIMSPDEIIAKFNGQCPKCGKNLKRLPLDVKVAKYEEREP